MRNKQTVHQLFTTKPAAPLRCPAADTDNSVTQNGGKAPLVRSDSPRQLKQGERVAQLRSGGEAATVTPSRGGLPDGLLQGIESLSGKDMSGVRVHRNSGKPAALQAHAYAQGQDIHLGPGQEKHLPHEAWHVVQQAQGRVKPNTLTRTGTPINDDKGLEAEADRMGAQAAQRNASKAEPPSLAQLSTSKASIQRMMREDDDENEEEIEDEWVMTPEEVEEVAVMVIETGDRLDRETYGEKNLARIGRRVAQLQKDSSNAKLFQQALDGMETRSKMKSWTINGLTYHVNLTTATSHVSREGSPMIHYFFEGSGEDIADKQPTKEERGSHVKKGEVNTKLVFSNLPAIIQEFVRTHWASIT